MGPQSDEQLIARAVAGSEKAWLTIVNRYETRLYNHAVRMVGNRDDAMDVMQDVFVSIYRNLSGFRGDAPFIAWMFRIVTYRCTDYLRKRRIETTEYDEAKDSTDTASPVKQLQDAQDNADIMALMQRLPIDQRQVIELKFFQNFTFDEISTQLGISSNTAKSRLYAALKKMREPGTQEQLAGT